MNLIYIGNELKITESIIEKIKNQIIDNPGFDNHIPMSFKIDISLLSLTIATHKGAINRANTEIEYCIKLLPDMMRRWESLDYYFIFKIRQGVHLINSYNMIRCIDEMNSLEKVIDNTFGLFHLAEGFECIGEEIKSDLKGKIYGNRLQARLGLMKNNLEHYQLAIEDSEKAILQFSRVSDLKRQYQYRSRIEYEAGNCTSAFEWLLKSLSKDNTNEDIEALLFSEIRNNNSEVAFTLMHFVNIQLLSFETRETEIYDKLEKIWKKLDLDNYIKNKNNDLHPYEIIFWKLSKLDYLRERENAGEEKIEKALLICNKNKENQALKAIGLGIIAEKLFLSVIKNEPPKIISAKISLLKYSYEEFLKMDLPLSMKSYFIEWGKEIGNLNINNINNYTNDLKKLSQRIYY